MILPNRVSLSLNATNKLRNLKAHTGLTPNILSRVAITKALESTSSLENAGVGDADGQVLSKDVMFGEHDLVYEVLIKQYIKDNKISEPIQNVIAALIEIGVHKIGHVKNIQQIVMN